VRDYLLSSEHPIGRAKARFFTGLGFRRDRWRELRDALLILARTGRVEHAAPSPFGHTYVLSGTIEGPQGRRAAVIAVWIVLRDEDSPRFVTAYPGTAE
jgi:hypothetical protein